MHGQIIIILKTDIVNAYISVHPHGIVPPLLFIDTWFIRYLYIL